jgi:hypothetical protein
MQDLIEAYMSVYDDLNEVKGLGGRVDPKTGKYTGEVSSPSQKVFQKFSKDVQTHGRQAVSSARSKSVTHGEPTESGVVRSQARGTDVTKKDPDLAMTPAQRMKTRATAVAARGDTKRANKIRAVLDRPNMEEAYMDEKRVYPGAPDRTHSFPLSDEEKEMVANIRQAANTKAKEKADESPTKSAKKRTKMSDVDVRESHDFFDVVLSHLLDEGYCDSQESAIAMMTSMSEEWIDSIISEAPFQISGPHSTTIDGTKLDYEPSNVGKPYQNKKRAQTRADKLNQDHGASVYRVTKVD